MRSWWMNPRCSAAVLLFLTRSERKLSRSSAAAVMLTSRSSFCCSISSSWRCKAASRAIASSSRVVASAVVMAALVSASSAASSALARRSTDAFWPCTSRASYAPVSDPYASCHTGHLPHGCHPASGSSRSCKPGPPPACSRPRLVQHRVPNNLDEYGRLCRNG